MQINKKGLKMVKLYKDWKKQGLEIIRFNSKFSMLSKIFKCAAFNRIIYGIVIENMNKQVI